MYGRETLADIHERLHGRAEELRVTIEARQTNHEGMLLDWIGESISVGRFDGLLINPGAYTHTSVAIYDAIKAVGLPCVEVHLSNPDAREAFRRHSYVAPACVGRIAGFGGTSYLLALEGIVAHVRNAPRSG